jgi:hypothetical protein
MNQRGVFAKYGFICSFKIQFLCVKHSNFLYPVPASPTTKTGRHDIAESGVKHQNSKLKKKI